MKTVTLKNIMSFSGVALALGMAAAFPLQLQATEPMQGSMMDGSKTEWQKGMMQRHQALMAEMKTQDDELTDLVAKMNKASKDKKLDLLASIVTRMVEQRATMNQRMMKMQCEMMPTAMGNEKMKMPMMNDDMKTKPATEPMDMK